MKKLSQKEQILIIILSIILTIYVYYTIMPKG
jgi:hypothetical protein